MKNDKSLKQEIGMRLRKARQEIEITRKNIAFALDMHVSNICHIESGKIFPGITLMLFLFKKFRVSPLWLIAGEGDMIVGSGSDS